MTSIFQAGQPFNLVRTSSATHQANDKDLVISSGDEVALPSPNQGATVLVRPAPSIDSVKITTSNGTIENTGETFGIYRATEPIYLVGDGTNWYARSGGGEISAIPDSGILRWTFDDADTSGGNILDYWNSNDGTINGATTGVSGANQTYDTAESYSFDGTDDNITSNYPGVSVGTNPVSVSFWAKQDSSALGAPFFWGSLSSGGKIEAFFNTSIDGNFQVGVGDGKVETDDESLDDGNWHHLIWTNDGSGDIANSHVYVDGAEVTLTKSSKLISLGSTFDLTVASRGDNKFHFDGSLDDFRIYSKELTPTEASNLYNNGSI